ncbi:CLUMA_CG012772, isoform A [Clunio marinus]|uniref:CLUMA_CG012772, isoform A n=1 Tax=Clunio marinus TaxID=568069 RepID=A0A1J1IIN5_9DIPT|nr:CLUMA_CG012772, isoform A [Clunio marinus]
MICCLNFSPPGDRPTFHKTLQIRPYDSEPVVRFRACCPFESLLSVRELKRPSNSEIDKRILYIQQSGIATLGFLGLSRRNLLSLLLFNRFKTPETWISSQIQTKVRPKWVGSY